MNGIYIPLYVNALYSQHLLNKPLAKREINNRVLFLSQQLFSIVEKLLRVYIISYQHSHILIHQFNKKKNDITGIQVVPL